MTPLDQAHAQMMRAEEDTGLRLRYFEQLVRSPLFLLLERLPRGAAIAPRLREIDGIAYVLAFDDEARLAAFAGAAASHVALEGRALAAMLKGRSLGLAVNLESGVSDYLLPPDAVAWLNRVLDAELPEREARPQGFHPPEPPEPALLASLAQGLKGAPGAAAQAWLVGASYADGGRGNLLALVDAQKAAEAQLRRIVADAVAFRERPCALDVAFVPAGGAAARALAQVGLEIPIPATAAPKPLVPPPPGSDPEKPPKLR